MFFHTHARTRIARAFAVGLAASAIVLGLLSWHMVPAPAPARSRIDAATGFDHVAVFAAGTSGAEIDAWRSAVLGRVHEKACADGRPCLRRLLRISTAGANAAEMLAFDLASDIPDAERAAILAAAQRVEPPALLRDAISPQQIAAN